MSKQPPHPDDVLARLEHSLLISQLEQEHYQRLRELLLGFLEVKDSLERIVAPSGQWSDDDAAQQVLRTVRLLDRQFQQTLTAAGVPPMDCIGQPVEPGVHEIVGVRRSDEAGDDIIVAEQRRGYRWEFGVLRQPRVIVAGQTSADQSSREGDGRPTN